MAKPTYSFNAGDDIFASQVNANFTELWSVITDSLVCGEDISINSPVFIADGSSFAVNITQSSSNNNVTIYGANIKAYQTFRTKKLPTGSTITLSQFQAYLTKTGSPAGNVQIDFYAVDAARKPTGSSLGSMTIACSSVSSAAYYTLTGSVSLSSNTEYAVMLKVASGDASNYVSWAINTTDFGGYSEGIAGSTSNGGSTYSLSSGCMKFTLDYSYVFGVAGKIYQCRADDVARKNYNGISIETKTEGQSARVQTSAILDGFTGLSQGKKYYVPDYNAAQITQSTQASGNSVYSGNFEGNTFTIPAGMTKLTAIRLFMYKSNSPTGDLTLEIKAVSAGLPTGSVLATKTIVSLPQSLPQSYSSDKYVDFVLDTPLTVTPGSVYCFYTSMPTGGDASNRPLMPYGSNPYAGGTRIYSSNSGGSWTADSGEDAVFTIFGNNGMSISTTPGTYEIRVGKAIEDTKLQVFNMNIGLANYISYTADSTVRQAPEDGFLVVVVTSAVNQDGAVKTYVDSNNSPTTLWGSGYASNTTYNANSYIVPIKQGMYWKSVVSSNASGTIYFVPIK